MRDVFQTRLLIEGEICALAALTISREALASLEVFARQFEEAWKKGDLIAHVEADLALHRCIAHAGPNRMLVSIYDNLLNLLSETQRQPIPNTDPERMRQSIAEHSAVIEALHQHDGRAARERMQTHIRNTARCAGYIMELS